MQERIRVVVAYHRAAKRDTKKPKVHALLHVNVENMLPQARGPATRAMFRLMEEGLTRHQAIHESLPFGWRTLWTSGPGIQTNPLKKSKLRSTTPWKNFQHRRMGKAESRASPSHTIWNCLVRASALPPSKLAPSLHASGIVCTEVQRTTHTTLDAINNVPGLSIKR